jgi:predicted metal-binding protein
LSRPSQIKNHEIVSKLEAEAFYDGYHLALGFAGGSCKSAFCHDVECSALKGEGCRHPLRARSAMEAVGLNAYVMAAKVGWDIYPVGRSSQTADVPHGIKLGLVLIY